jgi:serine/threonine protein kinase
MSRHDQSTPEPQLEQIPEPAEGSECMEAPAPCASEVCATHLRSDCQSAGSGQWWMPPQAPPAIELPPAGVPGTPAPVEAGDALLGTVVGSFRLVRKIGCGGMGTVYLGEHTLIGSKVAVKFLLDYASTNDNLVQRFLAEARAVNLIGHENIINIFDMNVLPPHRHYLIMEYLEGSPLSVMTGRPQAPGVVVPILTQVCDALQAAHLNGVVHRDLKPGNIFLVRHDRIPHFVKVLDFGVAKLLDGASSEGMTTSGMIIGTPEYMAPEQWYGHTVDGRTDLYALGIIAYELLTGRKPFGQGTVGNLLHAHLVEMPPELREVNPEVPVALAQVVMRALAKRAEDRYPDAASMREALEQALAAPGSAQDGPAEAGAPRTPPPGVDEAVTNILPAQPMRQESPASAPSGELVAQVVLEPGIEPARLSYTDLSRGGVFLCTDGLLPPLRSRVSLTLELSGTQLSCVGEVVHHVTPSQATTWKMRPGFAVQFLELPAEVREALTRATQDQAPVLAASSTDQDDPEAEALLAALLRRTASDPYALLSAPLDSTFDHIRQQARGALRHMETLAAHPLSTRQAQEWSKVRARLEKAAQVLGHSRQRIEHDAWRRNYAGVARCISSGFSATEIEVLQARFLEEHPGAEALERVHASTGAAWESQGQIDMALAEYERALTANPLRLALQQRYWTLKQHGAKPTPPPPPAPGQGNDVPGLRRRSGRP